MFSVDKGDKRRDCLAREVMYKHLDFLALKTTLYSSAKLSHRANIFRIALWLVLKEQCRRRMPVHQEKPRL